MTDRTNTMPQRLRRLAHKALKTLAPPLKPVVSEMDWAPSSSFVLHDEKVSTTVSFAPLTTTRSSGRYFWELRVYGTDAINPLYLYKSKEMGLFDQETMTSAELAASIGVERLFNYCEVMAYSPDSSPVGVSSVLVSYNHFTSSDGSVEAHLPASYMWGAARFTRTEKYHYENFPAVQLSPEFLPIVYVLNPFIRPMRYWIRLVDACGNAHQEGPFRVRGKSVSLWEGRTLPASLVSPAGLVVQSESKSNAFVGAIHRPSGRMVNLEHMHPFFSQ